jgi:hypothetical protein
MFIECMDNISGLQLVNLDSELQVDWVAKSIVQKLGTAEELSTCFNFHSINVAETLMGGSWSAIFIFVIHRSLAWSEEDPSSPCEIQWWHTRGAGLPGVGCFHT